MMKRIPKEIIQNSPNIQLIWDSFSDELKEFWNEVQDGLKGTVIIPEFAEEGSEQTFFVRQQICPLDDESKRAFNLNSDYITLFLLNKSDYQEYDVVHELAHIYVYSNLEYCYIGNEKKIEPPYLSRARIAMSVYNAAIHPVVDKVVKEKGFALDELYDRQLKSALMFAYNIKGKDFTYNDKVLYSLGIIIDSKHRLPPDYFEKVVKSLEDNQVDSLLKLASSLPIYDFDFENKDVLKQKVIDTLNMLKNNYEDYGLKIYEHNEVPFV